MILQGPGSKFAWSSLAGGAVLRIVALDVVATVLTIAFGWEFLKR